MLLECACGKMYRVRDDAPSKPTKCPKCGGTLKPSGGPAPASGPDPRVKELEAKLQELQQQVTKKDQELSDAAAKLTELQLNSKDDGSLEQARQRIAELEGQVEEARSAGAPGGGPELEQAQARIAELEKQVAEAASKDGAGGGPELEEARASIARLGSEQAKAQQAYREALERKEQEVHALQKQLESAGGGAPAASGGDGDAARKDLEQQLERALARTKGLEKTIQDGERKYLELQRQVEKAGGAEPSFGPDPRVAELEEQVQALQAQASSGGGGVDPAALGELREAVAQLRQGVDGLAGMASGLSSKLERVRRATEGMKAAAPAPPPRPAAPPPPPKPPVQKAEPEPEPEAPPAPGVGGPVGISLAEFPQEEAPEEELMDMGRMDAAEVEPVSAEELEEETVADEDAAAIAEGAPPEEEEAGDEPKKKGFFGKLFGK